MNYIWDFDGTLYDTYPIMLKALMETFKEFGIEKDEKEVYQKIKTESIRQMIIDWRLPVPDFDRKYHSYEAQKNRNSFPFKETKETLEKLQNMGGRHFILTHRTVDSTWQLLKRDGLDSLIVDIIGSDSNFPRKPDPSAIYYFIDNYQLESEKNTWYKLINHGYFNEIFASIQILKQSINLKNKMISLQELEKIKMVLENLMEDECYNFNRIF